MPVASRLTATPLLLTLLLTAALASTPTAGYAQQIGADTTTSMPPPPPGEGTGQLSPEGAAPSGAQAASSSSSGGPATYYYLKDRLGSVRAVVTSDSGAVVETRDYYPFGLKMPGRSYVARMESILIRHIPTRRPKRSVVCTVGSLLGMRWSDPAI